MATFFVTDHENQNHEVYRATYFLVRNDAVEIYDNEDYLIASFARGCWTRVQKDDSHAPQPLAKNSSTQ